MNDIYKTCDESFYEDMEGCDFVIVDFYKDPCPPCTALYPHLVELEADPEFAPSIMKMNYEESESIVMDLRIKACPTLVMFKNGKKFKTLYGKDAKANTIREWFNDSTRKPSQEG